MNGTITSLIKVTFFRVFKDKFVIFSNDFFWVKEKVIGTYAKYDWIATKTLTL